MHVYVITNAVNGKRYVGITDVGVDQRWKLHIQHAQYGARQAFACTIRKHGIESFKVDVLEECPDRETLYTREMHWIAELGTFIPRGYNMTLGGEGLAGLKHTDETRRKMSITRTGKKRGPFTDEQRRRCAETRKLNRTDHCMAETIAKLAEAARGKKRTVESKDRSAQAHWTKIV